MPSKKTAMPNVAQPAKHSGTSIIALTLKDILEEQIARKLA